jgi:fatty acid desaturase
LDCEETTIETLTRPELTPVQLAPRAKGQYAELMRQIKDRGLLDAQPAYYVWKEFSTLCLAAAGVAVLLTVGNFAVQLLNAVFLSFVFAQLGFIAHDTGHKQILRRGWKFDLLCLAQGNLLIGVSASWWVTKHNQHHVNPNTEGRDPDLDLPTVAFSARRARTLSTVQKAIIRRQAYLFVPMLLLEGFVLRISSLSHLSFERCRLRVPEFLLIAAHIAVYALVLFQRFSVMHAVIFLLVHQMVFGLFMGLVFAPNHKGMAILGKDDEDDFLLKQVLTSRNVSPHPVVDFLFGGLNFQIEHHLFPGMPRNRLNEARAVVMPFCLERGIPYCESGVLDSYRQVFAHLNAVGVSLKQAPA